MRTTSLNDESISAEQSVIEFLESQRNTIRSRVGGWFPGTGVFSHGYSMMDELIGEKSYAQILILNATGKLVEKKLADWIEAICGCLSWPDPRIWCNQIGALAGTARSSVVAATALGALASDSRAYGPFTLLDGVNFIQGALLKHRQGASAQDIVHEITKANRGKPYIVGYIRPIAKGDERIEAMERLTDKLGFEEGDHLILAYEIEKVLMEEFDEGMNINGYMSAFLSDQGFSAKEVYRTYSMMVISGVTACFIDTEERPAGSFLPMRCDDVDYQGKPPREIP